MRALSLIALALLAFAGAAAAQNTGQDAGRSASELRARLADAPGDAEARLDLARIYFEEHEDRAAEFNLRQALADRLSPDSAAEARDLLAALQRRRLWILTGDFSVAPSVRASEVSGAAKSGLGISASGSVERRQPIGESLRLSLEAQAYGADYEGIAFDEYVVTGFAGPMLLQRGDDLVSLRGLVQRQWYGGARNFDAVGVELAGRRSFGDRVRLVSALTVRDIDHRFDVRDGWDAALGADLQRFGPSGRFERLFAFTRRRQAEASSQAYWFVRAGAGAYREFPYGVGLYLEPSAAVQAFDGADPPTGLERTDWLLTGRARIIKRDWRLFGSAPFLALEVTRRESSVDLYDGTDTAIRAGFTRTF